MREELDNVIFDSQNEDVWKVSQNIQQVLL